MMYRIIEQDRHTVRIAEHECNTAVIGHHRISIGDTVCIVFCPAPRVTAKDTHDLRSMYLPQCTKLRGRKAKCGTVTLSIFPHSAGIIVHVQGHIECIIRRCADTAMTR